MARATCSTDSRSPIGPVPLRKATRERFPQSESRAAFLIDADQDRPPGGLANGGGEASEFLGVAKIARVENDAGEAARQIVSQFGGKERPSKPSMNRASTESAARFRIWASGIHLV